MKPRLVRLAESWTPDPDDKYGEDKRRLIRFLLENGKSAFNAITLPAILEKVEFTRSYHREALQHKLLGPLRRDRKVFVGTSSAGVFLVTTPEDVDATLGFYTWRIRRTTPREKPSSLGETDETSGRLRVEYSRQQGAGGRLR